MWTRELLKSNAKQALQGRYWRSFWVCLVLSFVGLGGASASSGSAARQTVDTAGGDTASIYDMFSNIPDNMLTALAVGAFIGAIISICWVLFVLYPLKVGRCRYFMESRQSLTPASTVVSTFRQPYGNPIIVQLLTDLKVFLGFLLLIVPGLLLHARTLSAGRKPLHVRHPRHGAEQPDDGRRKVELLRPAAFLPRLDDPLRVHLRHRRLLSGAVHAGYLCGVLCRYAQQGAGCRHDHHR